MVLFSFFRNSSNDSSVAVIAMTTTMNISINEMVTGRNSNSAVTKAGVVKSSALSFFSSAIFIFGSGRRENTYFPSATTFLFVFGSFNFFIARVDARHQCFCFLVSAFM